MSRTVIVRFESYADVRFENAHALVEHGTLKIISQESLGIGCAVCRNPNESVALYAPGAWVSVRYEEEEESDGAR